jgi:hypothetical protein
MPDLITKSDVATTKSSIVQWMLGIVVASVVIVMVALAVMFWSN